MVFRRKVIQEDVPVVTPIVTPVAQPVVERNTIVERDDMSGGTAIAVIMAGLLVIAMVWYFAWYQPQQVAVQPSTNTTVIEHDHGTAAQPIITQTPPVVNTPPVIVNPPANQNPSTTVVNPPANNTTIVNPPNTDTSATSTDSGSTTDNNGG